jgi:hypothetical protein
MSRKTQSILLFLIEVVMLCWPTLINRGAVIVFPDTRSYYVAGRAAVVKGLTLIRPAQSAAPTGGDDPLESAIQKARAVRSVFYSMVTYLSGQLGTLWFAIIMQAMIVALLLRLMFDLLHPHRPRWHVTTFISILALLTTASWVVSNAMPDVYAPIAILATITTIVLWDRCSRAQRFVLFIIIAGSAIMHLTNPPTVAAVLAVGLLMHRKAIWQERARFLAVSSAVVIALMATLAVSVIGFKQWTLAPNAPPFLLARSLDDGPGKLYLREHCPQIGLVMCNHLDRLDVGDDDFIWHDNGVYSSVPLEEAALLRKEDKRIYVAAALEHPWMQFAAIVENSLQQLGLFTLCEYMIPSYGYADPNNPPDEFTLYIRPSDPSWQNLLAIPEYAIVIAALGYAFGGSRRPVDREILWLVLAAVIANAVVCSFSISAPRYEARVIWLVPMIALLFGYRARLGDGSDE